MLYSLLQKIDALSPNSSFSILSRNSVCIPDSVKHRVKFVSDEKPLSVILEILSSSTLILGGGTHLYDYGIRVNRIMRLTQLLILTLIAKIAGKNIYFFGIGVENPSTIYGKALIKNICMLADAIIVRDGLSFEALTKLGIKSNLSQGFDLAALLNIPKREKFPINNMILGISVMPFFKIFYSNEEKDSLFITKIAEGLNQWLNHHEQGLIYLFVFKGKSKDDDVLLAERLISLIEKKEKIYLIPYNPNPQEMLVKVSECHAFVGMRYHSCIFAYLSGLPLLIINYAEKNESLKIDVGLPDNAIISLDEIGGGYFKKRIDQLCKEPEKFKATVPPNLIRLKSWPAYIKL